MNYLLTGAEFNNKGAEAMTLVALKNIYEKDAQASVFLLDSGFYPSFELKAPLTFIPLPIWNLRILSGRMDAHSFRMKVKDFIKLFIPGKKSYFGTLYKVKEILSKIDVVIDISGFAFSSKWGDESTIDWLSQIDLLAKNGAKIWLMPQSFGPFDFNSKKVVEYGKFVLERCECVFAREETGYKLLKDMGLKNIKKSPDSVLLEKNFNPSVVIKNYNSYIENIDVLEEHNIALVPNQRLVDVGGLDRERLLGFYSAIINKYADKFHFYLVAHAGEDLKICKKISELFQYSNRVTIIDHVMYSFNYENFSKKMDFIIASRYHSIIHAYKEGTPAVVLGWADKYKGIVSDVGQEEYLIDLNLYDKALSIVDKMAENYSIESEKIKESVKELQNYCCYGFLSELDKGK